MYLKCTQATQLANGVMLFSILSCFKLYRLVLFFFYAIFLVFQASAYFSFNSSMSVECICNFLQEVERRLSINNKTWYSIIKVTGLKDLYVRDICTLAVLL